MAGFKKSSTRIGYGLYKYCQDSNSRERDGKRALITLNQASFKKNACIAAPGQWLRSEMVTQPGPLRDPWRANHLPFPAIAFRRKIRAFRGHELLFALR